MRSENFKRGNPRGSLLRSRMADTPHGAHHPARKVRKSGKFKRSIYYGFLVYILRTEFDNLTIDQQDWIVNFARRLSDEEILRAGRHTQLLLSNVDISFFHARDILQVRRSIPWLEPFQTTEAVRIGKGYTDKGALRPLHKKGTTGELCFWDSDIQSFLPFNYVPEGKWITADEVESLSGIPLELIARQLNQGVDLRISNQSVDYQNHNRRRD